jgi:methionine synthase I (cobalamin-dependent)
MSLKPNLTDACRESHLTCDGAMGTQLIQRGMTTGECGMRWNAERPADIVAVHRAYRDAGCRLITTNSFGMAMATGWRNGTASPPVSPARPPVRMAG